jgi:hypothetical protein
MCTGKTRFRDELAAKMCLARLQRIGDDAQRAKTPRRAYRCPRCRGWHLTALARHGGTAARG